MIAYTITFTAMCLLGLIRRIFSDREKGTSEFLTMVLQLALGIWGIVLITQYFSS